MEAIHAEYISVTFYREMFEKMHKVISSDRDSTALCAARCRAILNDLLKLLSATERRLTNSKCGSTLETNAWLFHFEAMIAPLSSSVQEVESSEDADSLESRVIKASMIIKACLPLMQSHHYALEEALYSDPHADHYALAALSAEVSR